MSNVLSGFDIVVLSPSEWRDNAVSNMHISSILSESNNVIYVETMGGRLPRLSELGRVWQRLKRIFIPAISNDESRGLGRKNVEILSPFAIPLHSNKLISIINRKLLVFQINRKLRKRAIKNPLIWSFSPRWLPIIKHLQYSNMIFHCVDALHTYDASPEFKEQYIESVALANIVFTPGILLEQELKEINKFTYRIGHGCGMEHLHYNFSEVPIELHDIPEPRVIYSGTLANWVDYDLIYDVAYKLPNVSFVLIGYIHALAPRDKVQKISALKNIHLLGYKDFKDLPVYYHASKIGIVPYQASNEHIQYSTPTKFLDYLAAGLPVISTRFPAAEAMNEWVKCIDTVEEFVNTVEYLLQNDTDELKENRRSYAATNEWGSKVSEMSNRIRECIR